VSEISWDDFQQVELRAGTITKVEPFPEARRPAYKLWIDFGEPLGVKKSSAQITALYDPGQLLNRQVIAVTNFPRKQIGSFMSEVLVTGFIGEDGEVVLAVPERTIANGSRLA